MAMGRRLFDECFLHKMNLNFVRPLAGQNDSANRLFLRTHTSSSIWTLDCEGRRMYFTVLALLCTVATSKHFVKNSRSDSLQFRSWWCKRSSSMTGGRAHKSQWMTLPKTCGGSMPKLTWRDFEPLLKRRGWGRRSLQTGLSMVCCWAWRRWSDLRGQWTNCWSRPDLRRQRRESWEVVSGGHHRGDRTPLHHRLANTPEGMVSPKKMEKRGGSVLTVRWGITWGVTVRTASQPSRVRLMVLNLYQPWLYAANQLSHYRSALMNWNANCMLLSS